MSQPLRVAGFEVIISGRFWVITKAEGDYFSGRAVQPTDLQPATLQVVVVEMD